MTIVGHDLVTRVLEDGLPPVTLLQGPPSIGKWTLAQHLACHHRVAPTDLATYPTGLRIDDVRRIISFAGVAPHGRFKLVLARLEQSSAPALHALLKTLEEPPPALRLILTTSAPTLATIASRCCVFRLGLLTPDELCQILLTAGVPPLEAHRVALFGRGQVKPALASREDVARGQVLALVRALATHDRLGFDRAVADFDEAALGLLLSWLVETITGQWLRFEASDAFGLNANPVRLRQILVALAAVSGARARLGVRTALEPFLAG